jgi:hypothetical protein
LLLVTTQVIRQLSFHSRQISDWLEHERTCRTPCSDGILYIGRQATRRLFRCTSLGRSMACWKAPIPPSLPGLCDVLWRSGVLPLTASGTTGISRTSGNAVPIVAQRSLLAIPREAQLPGRLVCCSRSTEAHAICMQPTKSGEMCCPVSYWISNPHTIISVIERLRYKGHRAKPAFLLTVMPTVALRALV